MASAAKAAAIARGAKAKRTPAAKTPGAKAPAAPVKPPAIPGDRPARRGPPPRAPGAPLSMHPAAVRARERTAKKRAKREAAERRRLAREAKKQLQPAAPPAPDRDTLTPETLRALEDGMHAQSPGAVHAPAPAITGPISGPISVAPTPQEVKSFAGLVKVLGILAAIWGGEHWKVPDDDAVQTAELCLDAWPELRDLGDVKKVLALGAVGGMVGERVRKTKALRTGTAVTAPRAPDRPATEVPLSDRAGWSDGPK